MLTSVACWTTPVDLWNDQGPEVSDWDVLDIIRLRRNLRGRLLGSADDGHLTRVLHTIWKTDAEVTCGWICCADGSGSERRRRLECMIDFWGLFWLLLAMSDIGRRHIRRESDGDGLTRPLCYLQIGVTMTGSTA
jgi:hypothetical protein